MSRKTAIMATGGLLVVAIIGLWPGIEDDPAGPPAYPQAKTLLTPADAGKPPTAARPAPASDTIASSGATHHGSDELSVFGEAVRFMPGDLCDPSGECRREPVALHEYAEYTDEQLKTLSAFDGAAAIVLANRLGGADWEEARRYAARGFVLTGDPYAFHMAQQFSGVTTGALFDRDGSLDITSARRAYLWVRLGYELGVNDAAVLDYQASILNEHGLHDLSDLDAAVETERRRIEAARLHLVGEGFK